MNKMLSLFCIISMFSLVSPNLYAQPSGSGYQTTTTDKTTTTTDSMSSDTVGSEQSSTKSTNCVTDKSQGTICGSKATTWCNKHMSAAECRKLHNKTGPSSENESDSDSESSSK